MISIFGRNVIIATSGKMATDYRRVLCQNTSRKIMASKVGVPPLKGQISKTLSMLKVKRSVGNIAVFQ